MVDVVLLGTRSRLVDDAALAVQQNGLTVLVVPPEDDLVMCELQPRIVIDIADADDATMGVGVYRRFDLEVDSSGTHASRVDSLVGAIVDLIAPSTVSTTRTRPVAAGDIEIDRAGFTCTVGGRSIDLTPTEFRLLLYLVENSGIVVSKEQILDRVFDFSGYQVNVVEVHISSLRRKIDHVGHQRIETVRGIGYVIRSTRVTAAHRSKAS